MKEESNLATASTRGKSGVGAHLASCNYYPMIVSAGLHIIVLHCGKAEDFPQILHTLIHTCI